MATSPNAPPPGMIPPPPDVAAQMGQSDPMMKAAGGMAAGLMGAGPHPQGALIAQGQAVENVIRQMGRMSEKFAPWGDKMVTLLKTGLAEASGGAQASPAAPASGSSSLRPPGAEGMASFPG